LMLLEGVEHLDLAFAATCCFCSNIKRNIKVLKAFAEAFPWLVDALPWV